MTDSPFRSTTPAGQTDELLNKPYLDRQFRDRNQHFSLLIEDFEELATLLMQRLAQAIERNDYSAYRDALHELAGTAGSLGAWAIERVCETASAWPPSQLAEAQPTLLVEIERTIVQTQVALVEYQRHRGLSVEALATDPTTVDRPPSSQPPRTLLLVEDNPLIRRQLREILHADYRLLETTTGSEALLYCQQTPPPDLVILDLKLTLRHDAKDEALTKVSGLELAHRFPHGLPFIVLTADRSRDTLRAACAAGAWSYCVKPPDADNLLATIEMALAHAQARQHLEWEQEHDRVISYVEGLLSAEYQLDRNEASRLLRRLASSERQKLITTATTLMEAHTAYFSYRRRCASLLDK